MLRNNFLLLISILVSNFIYPSVDSVSLTSKITDVTVFFSGAQITRKSDVRLKKGKHLLVLNGLPMDIDAQSIQVQRIDGSKILSVKHRLDYSGEIRKSNEVKDIEKKIKEEENEIKDIANRKAVFDIEERMLLDNSNFSKQEGGTNIAELKAAADYYRLKINEIKREKLKLKGEIESAQDNIQALYAELNKISAAKRKVFSQVLIAIDCEKEINSALELSYYIFTAAWSPTYDFRVESINDPLRIVYNANVYQSSGEDWKNVNIKLSTNDPALTGQKPALITWYINRQNPYQKNPATHSISGGNDGIGGIKGRVFDAETGEPLPFANVAIFNGDKAEGGSTTDFDGVFTIKPMNTGDYTVKVSYVGYSPQQYNGVRVNGQQTTNLEVQMTSENMALEEVVISEYAEPLIRQDDNTMGGTVYRRSPTRQVSGAVRGSRSSGSQTYIDGIKVRSKEEKETNYISNSIKTTVANLEYIIEIPYSIPSDGEDYQIKIKEASCPVNYVYYAVPKLDHEAFLTAQLGNWSSLNLLNGESSIFYQGTFIGRSNVDAYLSSDTMEISLGRDKNIVVKRDGNKEKHDKKKTGNFIKESVGWDITVRNNQFSRINIIVQDQYPLSPMKSIEVTLTESSDAKINEKTGMLTWNLEINPNEKKDLSFTYEVKYYKGLNINLE